MVFDPVHRPVGSMMNFVVDHEGVPGSDSKRTESMLPDWSETNPVVLPGDTLFVPPMGAVRSSSIMLVNSVDDVSKEDLQGDMCDVVTKNRFGMFADMDALKGQFRYDHLTLSRLPSCVMMFVLHVRHIELRPHNRMFGRFGWVQGIYIPAYWKRAAQFIEVVL